MSSTNSYKAPPRKTENLTFENWKKEVAIWEFQTSLEKIKQGGALYLSLEGKARETALAELDPATQINCNTGVANIMTVLAKFYKKDESKSAYFAFDDFIKYKRDPSVSLKDYLIEFNLKIKTIENFNMKLPSGVLAYFLLSCVNISQEKMEICRATCSDLTYEKMRETIEKVGVGSVTSSSDTKMKFASQEQSASTSTSSQPLEMSSLQIKQEPVFHAGTDDQYEYFESSDEDVFYGNDNRGMRFKKRYGRSRRGGYPTQKFNSYKKYGGSSFNPSDEFGNTMTCKYCHSLCHMVAVCPDCPEDLKRKYQSRNTYASKPNNPAYL